MLEYLTAASLLLLIIAMGYLIKGCFGIHQELPNQGNLLGSKITRVAELIDEVCQLISDFSDNMGHPPTPQPSSNPMEAILTSLISNISMPSGHGSQEEREIYPTDEDTQQTQEDIQHQ